MIADAVRMAILPGSPFKYERTNSSYLRRAGEVKQGDYCKDKDGKQLLLQQARRPGNTVVFFIARQSI